MSSDAGPDVARPAAVEWPFVRAGLAVVAALAVAQLVGWGIWSLVHEEPTRYQRTVRCLTREKGLPVETDLREALLWATSGGAFHTVIEGNGVTVWLHRDEAEGRTTVERYQRIAGPLTGRLLQRWRAVYLFDGPYSPTQLQALIDCEYVR
ncbi:MAG: hypothetical protein FJW96_01840 [Actinobacteria bacterium]|nr:hypothetical protein [Actinomycetota bacterium]